MGAESDRRGFFGDFLREAADAVREVNAAMRFKPGWTGEREPWDDSKPVPARPASRPISGDDLSSLCHEVGLKERLEQVRGLVVPSFRLTRAEPNTATPGSSHLGGAPDIPAELEWPTRQGRDLAFLGQLNLAEVAALDPGGPLPARGLLLFFYDAQEQPSGLEPAHRGSCRVVHVDSDAALSCDRTMGGRFPKYPLQLSLELMLPRSWSRHVEGLDLDERENAAWGQLREALARAQGVELEELTPRWQALHRLLGYPEDLTTEMELDCELVSAGNNLAEGEGYFDPQRDELEAAATRDWRMLMQLSDDNELGVSWGDGFGRLYLWIRERELRAHAFDGVWAMLR